MAIAKSKKEKKKGPKGKKARAKAKLERQWGEEVDEVQQHQMSLARRGQSRLQDNRKKHGANHQGKSDGDSLWNKHREEFDPEDDSSTASSDDGDGNDNSAALSLLLEDIRKKSPKSKRKKKDQNESISRIIDEQDLHQEENGEDSMQLVEEEEEEMETSEDEDEQSEDEVIHEDDEDDQTLIKDPFSSHFLREALPDDEDAVSKITATQKYVKVPTSFLDRSLELQLSGPPAESQKTPCSAATAAEHQWNDTASSLFQYNRKVLRQGWRKINKRVVRYDVESRLEDSLPKDRIFSSLQCTLYPSLATYSDILITAETRQNRSAWHNILQLHLLNHVLTSRSRIKRNNRKVKDLQQEEEEQDPEKLRDQGYTRATVLVLLPTRGTCHAFLQDMLRLLGDKVHVDNNDRFQAEFGPPLEEENDKDETEAEKRKRRKAVQESKGKDWLELFGDETNDDDDFKIGLAVTPKVAGISKKKKDHGQGGVSVKLYSDFYRSDIILASPLGLKMSVEASQGGEPDADFLSSIEVCVVGHSNVLLMQNWDHVNTILGWLNQQPTKNNDTDFSRVRPYLLAGQAKYWRQLIVYSNLVDASILSTFKHYAQSLSGRLKLKRRTPVEEASLCNVMVRAKQVFQRVESTSFANQAKDRLRYFEDRILPQLRRLKQSHTMVFIPSYFDFVSVRNLLLKKEMDFVSVTEYARVSEVSRGRARFLQGRKPLMLYTGRCHFFSRHTLKGVRHLILLGLPEHPEFYADVVNMLNLGLEGGDFDTPTSCMSLFTKYDAHALDRIVGSKHCERMIKGEQSTFLFCS